MKKDVISLPLLPFTDEEEAALSERLTAMDGVALGRYVESARLSLGNKGLDASWRPRIQIGLERAEAVLLAQSLLPPVVVEEEPAPAPKAAKAAKTSKAAKAKAAKAGEPAADTEADADADADEGDAEVEAGAAEA